MSLLDPIRRRIPPWIKRSLKKGLGLPPTHLHPDWKILAPIGPVYERHILIDAGSHHGWFLHCWKNWCPGAVVHAFDADASATERSRELYGSDPDVHVINVGLGRTRSEGTFHVFEGSRVSSSFLAPEQKTWDEVDYHTGLISEKSTALIALDEYALEQGLEEVYLLKIDVQGFEGEVLAGATELLKRTRYVFVEAAIRPLYQGAPRFSGVFDFLDAHGFHLIAMRAWHRGNLTLVESDMLFRRNDLMPPIDPSVDRVMVQV